MELEKNRMQCYLPRFFKDVGEIDNGNGGQKWQGHFRYILIMLILLGEKFAFHITILSSEVLLPS